MSGKVGIGIDLGGTHTVIGLIDSNGAIVAKTELKTGDYPEFEKFVIAVNTCIKELLEKSGSLEAVGIGIGAPAVNEKTGCIDGSVDLPWRRAPIEEAFREATGLSVKAANDANVAAAGEQMYGKGRISDDFIVLTLGTGVGSGIVSDGHLISGHRGMAGELGHTIIRKDGRECTCGLHGCLEAYASARGVVQTAREILKTTEEESVLREIEESGLTPKSIYDAACKADKIAIETFRQTGEILGEACANFVAFSAPEWIVLFGGISKAGDYLMKPLKQSFDKHLLHIYKGHCEVCITELSGADAALLGAGALAWKYASE